MMDCAFLLTILCLFQAANYALSHGGGHEKGEEHGHGKEFDVGGVYCKALGHSGKLMCARPHKGEKQDFTDNNRDRVIIEFDSVQERSRGGNTVGKVGRRGHVFDGFSKQDFNFTDVAVGAYQGLRVKNFNFSSSLPGPNASLTVMAYMFEEDGNITFGNETSEMRKGMLKFNIQIDSWKFCANNSHEDCNSDDEGEFIDVTLVIKSKGKPKPHLEDEDTVKSGALPERKEDVKQKIRKHRPRCFKRDKYSKCPKEFDIGGGSEIVLSSQVMVDNEIREMPGDGDYPKFMEKENKQKFIFRFPKAANRILYDPGLEVGEEESSVVNIMPLSLVVLILINCLAFFFSF